MFPPQRLRKFGVLCPLVLLVLTAAWWFESWRGARAWEEAKAHAREAGVSLDRTDYTGPEIPDEENLLLNSVFLNELEKEGEDHLGQFLVKVGMRSDIDLLYEFDPSEGRPLEWEKVFKETSLQKLKEAVAPFEKRLDSLAEVILKGDHSPLPFEKGSAAEMNEIGHAASSVSSICLAFQDSAFLCLRLNKPVKALQRFKVADQLIRSLEGPSLFSLIISCGPGDRRFNLIWEGIRLRSWNAKQLEELKGMIPVEGRRELLAWVYGFEAALMTEVLETSDNALLTEDRVKPGFFSRYGPPGWQDQRKAYLIESTLRMIEFIKDGEFDRVEEIMDWLRDRRFPSPSVSLSVAGSLASLVEPVCQLPEAQARIAWIALSAEKQFSLSGQYPKTISELEGLEGISAAGLEDVGYRLGRDGTGVLRSGRKVSPKMVNPTGHLAGGFGRKNEGIILALFSHGIGSRVD